MGSLSIWHWLIVLAIILLVFGTKKLRNMGPDLGAAIREFKKSLGGDDDSKEQDKDTTNSALHNESAESKAADSVDAETRDRTR